MCDIVMLAACTSVAETGPGRLSKIYGLLLERLKTAEVSAVRMSGRGCGRGRSRGRRETEAAQATTAVAYPPVSRRLG